MKGFIKDSLSEIWKNKWLLALFIFLILCLMASLSSIIMGDDNPLEEYIEDIIEEEYRIPLDFSPSSSRTIIEPSYRYELLKNEDETKIVFYVGVDF